MHVASVAIHGERTSVELDYLINAKKKEKKKAVVESKRHILRAGGGSASSMKRVGGATGSERVCNSR